jgi:mitochondrial GTPase 1
MVQRGGIPDQQRAAVWLVQWWREKGGLAAAAAPAPQPGRQVCGWGFDLEWRADGAATAIAAESKGVAAIQAHMEGCIDTHMAGVAARIQAGEDVSTAQEKRRVKEERAAQRAARVKTMLAARGIPAPRRRR